jgi:polyhydroxyalkanoate synthesis regulator phasin
MHVCCREIRDLKSQLSSQVSETSSQTLQEVLRERDTIKADRNRLLTRVSQLERDVSKLEVLERQKAAAVSTTLFLCSTC